MRLALALAGLALGACTDRHVSFATPSTAPLPPSITAQKITIAVGIAAQAKVTAVGSDGKALDDDDSDSIRLEPEDPRVLNVLPGPDNRGFVFLGAAPGTTRVRVRFGSDSGGTIAAEVTEQPAPSP